MVERSDVAIANLALVSIGASTIIDLDEDSENARKIKAVYYLIRDEVLRSFPWNFAIRWASLAALSETPVNGYTYAHQLPTDPFCLKVIRLDDDHLTYPYRIEGGKLYADFTPVVIQYIARVEDPTQYDAAFITAFATRLAAEVAFAITGSQTLAKEKMQEYIIKMRHAKSLDSQEGVPEVIDESSWINERGYETTS